MLRWEDISLRLMALSLLLFVPLAGLGFKSAEWPIYLQLLPLFISLFLFGMPHGGADHLLLWGMLRKDSCSRRIVTLSLYTLIALAYLTFWDFNPPAAALFFLGLTIFHWGQGDRYISVQVHRATYHSRSKVLSALHILSRGSIPILLPGYLGNDTYRNVIEATSEQRWANELPRGVGLKLSAGFSPDSTGTDYFELNSCLDLHEQKRDPSLMH